MTSKGSRKPTSKNNSRKPYQKNLEIERNLEESKVAFQILDKQKNIMNDSKNILLQLQDKLRFKLKEIFSDCLKGKK